MTSFLFISAIISGLVLLIWGADKFIDGAAGIASNLGVAPLIVGLTIVGFGTSAPEMIVSAFAAFDGAPALGIGNAIGSNITNIGLVLGVTILVTPLAIHSITLRREFPVLVFIMFLSLLLLLWDMQLDRIDGLVLFTGFILTLGGMAWLAVKSAKDDPLKIEFTQEYQQPKRSLKKSIVLFLTGLIALLGGAKLLVWGATGVAQLLGISDLVIGLTVVAIGTSLPELAACISSALKNEHDIAVGNILGSNIFNLLAVLAMPGLIHPTKVDSLLLTRDFSFMIGLTIVLYLFARFCLKGRLGRPVGLLLLLVYAGYISLLAYQGVHNGI
ncbi:MULTISPECIES: calcium/sodium antiporter [unclassified Methylophaga]|jgi:cation:H+ antiporter|nr:MULTISPECIES: calcium/sodium antiporter [unclassified Methylophaga]MAL50874.1 calcium/sodium antiporter [Methylophaga sp.]MBP25822.1 calcium/sodium antiporter [Methylophaga sp.]HCC80080.1 calcium/sodium antiporter [Methylophaga sp.]|tara:strand:- start:1120 stop:2106 length:987 start_codon:yes stop_codon:yes gene_type:complete